MSRDVVPPRIGTTPHALFQRRIEHQHVARRRSIRAPHRQTERFARHAGKRVRAARHVERELGRPRMIARVERRQELIADRRGSIGCAHDSRSVEDCISLFRARCENSGRACSPRRRRPEVCAQSRGPGVEARNKGADRGATSTSTTRRTRNCRASKMGIDDARSDEPVIDRCSTS